MSDWKEVANLDEIPRLGSRVVEVENGSSIALFRTSDDRIFALRDACPHQQGPLSQGIVAGHTVTCPLHNWKIDLASGEALAPDEGCTMVYPVKVEAGVVHLQF